MMKKKKDNWVDYGSVKVKVERRLLSDIMNLLREIDTSMFSWKIVDNEKVFSEEENHYEYSLMITEQVDKILKVISDDLPITTPYWYNTIYKYLFQSRKSSKIKGLGFRTIWKQNLKV